MSQSNPTSSRPLRTIVVDDSIVFRKVVRDAMAKIPGVEVVDVAKDGKAAVEKILRMKPDLVTLDVEMPELDGLEVLRALRDHGCRSAVIMISSLTRRGAETTTQALELGAFDFILKPEADTIDSFRSQLAQRVHALPIYRDEVLRSTQGTCDSFKPQRSVSMDPAFATSCRIADKRTVIPKHVQAIFLGISTGGPKALSAVVPMLPARFHVPIILVQHMPAMFTATMASSLNERSGIHVVEATDGMPLVGGGVYIAPGGKHMRLDSSKPGLVAKITDDAPLRSCKPSVDYLFQSVSPGIAQRSLAVIMTGMGDDGREGCRHLKQHGATVWAQSEATCTVYGMPRQIIDSGLADTVFDLPQLPEMLNRLNGAAPPALATRIPSFSTDSVATGSVGTR